MDIIRRNLKMRKTNSRQSNGSGKIKPTRRPFGTKSFWVGYSRIFRSISDDHYHQAFDRLVELLPALRAIRLERNTLPPKRIEDSFLQRCRTHGICELRSGICQVRDAGSVTEQGIMDFIFDRPSLDEMTFLAATCSQVSRDFVKNLIQVSRVSTNQVLGRIGAFSSKRDH